MLGVGTVTRLDFPLTIAAFSGEIGRIWPTTGNQSTILAALVVIFDRVLVAVAVVQ